MQVCSSARKSGLRIWHCHSWSIGCNSGLDRLPAPGTSICTGQPKKKYVSWQCQNSWYQFYPPTINSCAISITYRKQLLALKKWKVCIWGEKIDTGFPKKAFSQSLYRNMEPKHGSVVLVTRVSSDENSRLLDQLGIGGQCPIWGEQLREHPRKTHVKMSFVSLVNSSAIWKW